MPMRRIHTKREPVSADGVITGVSTDADIIRRAGEHPRAFAELYERYARQIARFAIRRVGTDAADDVVSETFLVAYRKRATFDPAAESALPWLYGIASREVKRHRGAEVRYLRAQAASRGVASDSPDASGDAEVRLDAAASMRDLAPALAKLAARDRDTLLLYAWGDLTYEQVGAALGIPVGTVRSRLNRARRKLTATPAAARVDSLMGERA